MPDLLNVLRFARGGWTAGPRIIFRCLPSFMKTRIPFKKHASSAYTCCISVPLLSSRTQCSSLVRLNCPRKRPTWHNREPLQRVALQIRTRRSLRSGEGMIILNPEETELTGCSCFVCNNSDSELSRHSFHVISLISLTFCFIFVSPCGPAVQRGPWPPHS
jgi:hypothetical protein